MMKKYHVITSVFLAMAMLTAGCKLSQPYPAKQLYMLDPGKPASASSVSATGPAIRVVRVSIAEPFSRLSFNYKIGENQFQQDYYANFVASPDLLITNALAQWLTDSDQFQAVVLAASTVDTKYTLNGIVTQLYCDQTNPAQPQGVIAARFMLLDESDVAARVVMAQDYQARIPADSAAPGAVVKAWNAGLAKIFAELTNDLASVQ